MEEKTCGNCKYFIKFYYKGTHKVWVVRDFGKCELVKLSSKKNFYPALPACEKWELCDEEAVKLERKNVVAVYIMRMKKKLDELAALLEEEIPEA